MVLSVTGADRNGNPIETLTNPDTIRELQEFLAEVYDRPAARAELIKEPLTKSHH